MAKRQDHPPLGQARQSSVGAIRPAHTASTYIFGAICPKQGKAVGLILPWCNTADADELASADVVEIQGDTVCVVAVQSGVVIGPVG